MNCMAGNNEQPVSERSVTAQQATRLLQLGVAGPRRPIDAVIERLSAPDAAKWIDSVLEGYSIEDGGPARALLIDSGADVNRLITLKSQAKAAQGLDPQEQSPPHATLVYFLAIAAARAHRGVSISSQPRNEIDPILVDLADAAPAPWSDLLEKAAMAPIRESGVA